MQQWAGKDFYAEVFSLSDANTRLRRNRSLAAKEMIQSPPKIRIY